MTEDPRAEPGLFDLPLAAPPPEPLAAPSDPAPAAEPVAEEPPASRRRSARAAPRPETLPLFDLGPEPPPPRRSPAERAEVEERERPRPVALPRPAPPPPGAPLALRLWGAGGDLVIVAAAAAVAALGARWLGASVGAAELAPLGLFVLAWSFVYFVVPLAFWGATPGMSWAGIVARASASEPLSFGQAALRWLGTWLTWATLGAAGLVALSGRSLVDRLSDSFTFPAGAARG
jgi:uncharacterized RDD family membrane protein YckC